MVYLLILLVILAPLPLGSNNPLSWTSFAFVTGCLMIVYGVQRMVTRENMPVPLSRLAFPLICFSLACVWGIIQTLNFTPVNWHHPLWFETSKVLEQKLTSSISINPEASYTNLLRLMTYGGIFWLAVQIGRDRSNASVMLNGFGFAIVLYALYGIFQFAADSHYILWFKKTAYIRDVTSTFINRNTFATFAGVGCIILLGLFVRDIKRAAYLHPDESNKYRTKRIIEALSGRTSLYLLGLFVTLSSLLLSNSRGGLAAFIIGIFAFALINIVRSRIGIVGALMALAIGVVILFPLAEVAGDRMAGRLSHTEDNVGTRLSAYQLTWTAITHSPWLGNGLGTFEDVFPMYKDASLSPVGVWDKAHNTYLELMFELGVPAAILLFLAVGSCIWICIQGISRRRRDSHFAIIGVATSVVACTHALVDFSLQIPGFAIIYAAILGLCCTQSWSARD